MNRRAEIFVALAVDDTKAGSAPEDSVTIVRVPRNNTVSTTLAVRCWFFELVAEAVAAMTARPDGSWNTVRNY